VNSDPRAPAGRIRRSGQGQGTYVSRPSNPAPTSSLVPADDGMATQCRAQSRRCLRRALSSSCRPYGGCRCRNDRTYAYASERRPVTDGPGPVSNIQPFSRAGPNDHASRSRMCRRPRSRVRRKHQTSRGARAGAGRQAGMRRPREREGERPANASPSKPCGACVTPPCISSPYAIKQTDTSCIGFEMRSRSYTMQPRTASAHGCLTTTTTTVPVPASARSLLWRFFFTAQSGWPPIKRPSRDMAWQPKRNQSLGKTACSRQDAPIGSCEFLASARRRLSGRTAYGAANATTPARSRAPMHARPCAAGTEMCGACGRVRTLVVGPSVRPPAPWFRLVN
jgi:hypothetical protein